MPSQLILGGRSISSILRNVSVKNYEFIPTSCDRNFLPTGREYKTLHIFGSPSLMMRYGISININDFLEKVTFILSKNKIDQIVFISSAAVYGLKTLPELPINENSCLIGATPYAKEKLALEKLCLEALDATLIKYLLILRPSGFYSTIGDYASQNLLAKVFSKAAQDKNAKIIIEHGGQQIRDYCNITSLVNFIEAWKLEDKRDSEILNFSTTKPFKVKEILQRYMEGSNIIYDCNAGEEAIHSSLSLKRLKSIGLLTGSPIEVEKVEDFAKIFKI